MTGAADLDVYRGKLTGAWALALSSSTGIFFFPFLIALDGWFSGKGRGWRIGA